MKHNGSFIISFLEDEVRKFLLIKALGSKDNMFELPGGGVIGNESTLHAACRRLFKECGIEVNPCLEKVELCYSALQKDKSYFDVYHLELESRPMILEGKFEISDHDFLSEEQILLMRGLGAGDGRIRFAALKAIICLLQEEKETGKYLSGSVVHKNVKYSPRETTFLTRNNTAQVT